MPGIARKPPEFAPSGFGQYRSCTAQHRKLCPLGSPTQPTRDGCPQMGGGFSCSFLRLPGGCPPDHPW
eukprot:11519750-Alexandrium_andersonii.AAC.1